VPEHDLDKALATLRLYREEIEEAILTMERITRGRNQKLAFPTWVKRTVPRTQKQVAVPFRSILANLRRERNYIERAILYVEREARKSQRRRERPPAWMKDVKTRAGG
jgi:hypothetical protein